MNAFTNFLTKGAEFYLSASNFFNWGGPILFGLTCVIVYGAYWLGARLEGSSKETLKDRIGTIEERLKFAKDQSDDATRKAQDLKSELADLKKNIDDGVPILTLQNSTAHLDIKASNLLQANTALSSTLTPASIGNLGRYRSTDVGVTKPSDE